MVAGQNTSARISYTGLFNFSFLQWQGIEPELHVVSTIVVDVEQYVYKVRDVEDPGLDVVAAVEILFHPIDELRVLNVAVKLLNIVFIQVGKVSTIKLVLAGNPVDEATSPPTGEFWSDGLGVGGGVGRGEGERTSVRWIGNGRY